MIWPAIVLVLLLVVPGAILGVASGLRSGWALALGPALTFAVTGLAGWLYGAIDVGCRSSRDAREFKTGCRRDDGDCRPPIGVHPVIVD